MRPTIKAINPVKSGLGRYTMLLVGLGAAGVAIGWIAPETGDTVLRRR